MSITGHHCIYAQLANPLPFDEIAADVQEAFSEYLLTKNNEPAHFTVLYGPPAFDTIPEPETREDVVRFLGNTFFEKLEAKKPQPKYECINFFRRWHHTTAHLLYECPILTEMQVMALDFFPIPIMNPYFIELLSHHKKSRIHFLFFVAFITFVASIAFIPSIDFFVAFITFVASIAFIPSIDFLCFLLLFVIQSVEIARLFKRDGS